MTLIPHLKRPEKRRLNFRLISKRLSGFEVQFILTKEPILNLRP